jgi:hypothetical protein
MIYNMNNTRVDDLAYICPCLYMSLPIYVLAYICSCVYMFLCVYVLVCICFRYVLNIRNNHQFVCII